MLQYSNWLKFIVDKVQANAFRKSDRLPNPLKESILEVLCWNCTSILPKIKGKPFEYIVNLDDCSDKEIEAWNFYKILQAQAFQRVIFKDDKVNLASYLSKYSKLSTYQIISLLESIKTEYQSRLQQSIEFCLSSIRGNLWS